MYYSSFKDKILKPMQKSQNSYLFPNIFSKILVVYEIISRNTTAPEGQKID